MRRDITDKMRALAERYELLVLKNLKDRPNYAGIFDQHRYLTGFLGEFIFLDYCKEVGVECHYNIQTSGESEQEDMLLYYKNGKPVTVDVKTASKGSHKYLMIPEKTYYFYSYDFYIGVQIISEAEGCIHGYCRKSELRLKKEGFGNHGVPTYHAAFSDLHGIHELSDQLRRGPLFHNITAN